jgi:hypothetical protein
VNGKCETAFLQASVKQQCSYLLRTQIRRIKDDGRIRIETQFFLPSSIFRHFIQSFFSLKKINYPRDHTQAVHIFSAMFTAV